MKKFYLILLLLLLTFCNCNFSNRVPIYLLIYSEDILYYDPNCNFDFSMHLWIDDALIYEGGYRPGYKSPVNFLMSMGYMKKDSISKQIRIKIDDHDTTFTYKRKENMDNVIIRYYHYYPYPDIEPHRFTIDTIKMGLD